MSNYSCIGTNIVTNGLERSDEKSVFVYVPSPVSVKVTSRSVILFVEQFECYWQLIGKLLSNQKISSEAESLTFQSTTDKNHISNYL